MRKLKNRGFTLLELLVVVVVLGILATIAVPRIVRGTEVARQAEARTILGHIYQAEKMYSAEQNKYTDIIADLFADVPNNGSAEHYFTYRDTTDATKLAIDGNIVAPVPDDSLTPLVDESKPGKIKLKATRKTAGGKDPNYKTDYTITIDENGKFEVGTF